MKRLHQLCKPYIYMSIIWKRKKKKTIYISSLHCTLLQNPTANIDISTKVCSYIYLPLFTTPSFPRKWIQTKTQIPHSHRDSWWRRRRRTKKRCAKETRSWRKSWSIALKGRRKLEESCRARGSGCGWRRRRRSGCAGSWRRRRRRRWNMQGNTELM